MGNFSGPIKEIFNKFGSRDNYVQASNNIFFRNAVNKNFIVLFGKDYPVLFTGKK
jgi:hypothetical protein